MAFTKILPAGISTTGTVTLERVETTNSIVSLGSTNQLYINTDTPTVRPTLDLNFERDQRLDSRITFSRDSTATYLGSDGLIKTVQPNIPRFEFDTNGNCLGLLIEEQRTNIHIYSIPGSNWNTSNASLTENNTTSPDGATTASLFTGTGGTSVGHFININQTIADATTYTQSFFVKAGTTNYVQIAPSTGFDSRYQNFDLANGVLGDGDIGDSGGTASITAYPNGWYRISVTQVSTSAGPGRRMVLASADSTTTTRLANTAETTFYVWGAQLEAGSFPTSYIPTSGSTVTRSADKAKITGTNFTDFYNQTEGTIFFRYKNLSLDTSTIRGVWGLENSSAPVSGVRSPQSGSLRIRLLYNNNFSPAASNLFFISTDYQNGIVSYNQTENRLMMNGTSDFVSATHTNDNDIIAMSIGSRTTNGDSPLGGHISHLTYYPQRLSNAQLQNLTS